MMLSLLLNISLETAIFTQNSKLNYIIQHKCPLLSVTFSSAVLYIKWNTNITLQSNYNCSVLITCNKD